jgi:hypothetical protein
LHKVNAGSDVRDGDDSTWVHVVGPGAFEDSRAAVGLGVEKACLGDDALVLVREVDDAKSGAVVGKVGVLALWWVGHGRASSPTLAVDCSPHVQVVVNRCFRVVEASSFPGSRETGNVPNVRTRASSIGCATLLVELIVEKQTCHFFVQPTLVSVGRASVAKTEDDLRPGLLGDVVDGESFFVKAETDLSASVSGVGSTVYDALCI